MVFARFVVFFDALATIKSVIDIESLTNKETKTMKSQDCTAKDHGGPIFRLVYCPFSFHAFNNSYLGAHCYLLLAETLQRKALKCEIFQVSDDSVDFRFKA